MASAQEAVERVEDFLANQLPLESFEDWSVCYLNSARQSGDAEAQNLARLIRSILSAYQEDTTKDDLRLELENAIYPFVLGPV